MRAKTVFKAKLFIFFNVISAGTMYFNKMKTGKNQHYQLFIDNFNLGVPKWTNLIDLSRINVKPVYEEYYMFHPQKDTMYMGNGVEYKLCRYETQ